MSCTATTLNGLPFVETARCSGHCCKRFYLPLSPEELKQSALEQRHIDIETIADMVIFLEKSKMRVDGTEGPEEGHYYTCRHFDEATGNCGIYERRPRMCSEYPYGSACKYTECTMRLEPMEGPAETYLQLKYYPRPPLAEEDKKLDEACAAIEAELKGSPVSL